MSTFPAAKRRPSWWNPGWGWKVWLMVLFLLIPTLGFALWVLAEAGGQTKIDPATLAVASKNADSPVTAITGTAHTVYHSNAPLPDARAPRDDSRLTLVWFTSGTCKECEDELFVHKVMNEYRARVVFVEKSVDRDTADERLGVEDTPTFVWLNVEGTEMARFGAVADEAAFRAELEKITTPQ